MTNTEKKIELLSNIEQNVISCVKCDLCFERNHVVFGEGNPNAETMWIGEGPGAEEDATGKPFCGRAGKLLTKWIEAISLTRKDVYISNICKCRPPNNRNPKPEEVQFCIPYLKEQINIIQPKVIVILGAVALKSLFQDSSLGIMQRRGQWREYNGVPVMPTYHPAFLLRQMIKNNKDAVVSDLALVVDKLKK